jgi:hypothetical protein
MTGLGESGHLRQLDEFSAAGARSLWVPIRMTTIKQWLVERTSPIQGIGRTFIDNEG